MSNHLEPSTEPNTRNDHASAPPVAAAIAATDSDQLRENRGKLTPEQLDATAAQTELSLAYAALLADNEAFRSRLEREKTRTIAADKVALTQTLLESIDDLERALAVVTHASVTRAQAIGDLTLGVQLSLATMSKRVVEMGAERMHTTGQRFDPRFAEAISTMKVTDPAQDGIILQEIRPGYHAGDQLLRPARVCVGRLERG